MVRPAVLDSEFGTIQIVLFIFCIHSPKHCRSTFSGNVHTFYVYILYWTESCEPKKKTVLNGVYHKIYSKTSESSLGATICLLTTSSSSRKMLKQAYQIFGIGKFCVSSVMCGWSKFSKLKITFLSWGTNKCPYRSPSNVYIYIFVFMSVSTGLYIFWQYKIIMKNSHKTSMFYKNIYVSSTLSKETESSFYIWLTLCIIIFSCILSRRNLYILVPFLFRCNEWIEFITNIRFQFNNRNRVSIRRNWQEIDFRLSLFFNIYRWLNHQNVHIFWMIIIIIK